MGRTSCLRRHRQHVHVSPNPNLVDCEILNECSSYLRGKTKEEAFRIGHEMADAVTAMNPAPVKLKFEKVYLPCVLMAKKRYVGFKYESVDAEEPGFDAKGIETVRRDGVLAQRKMVENCLKYVFYPVSSKV